MSSKKKSFGAHDSCDGTTGPRVVSRSEEKDDDDIIGTTTT